jgi:thiol:disulfide interchange protein DsbD
MSHSRTLTLALLSVLFTAITFAGEPAITWYYQLSNPKPVPGETVELVLTAKIAPHHILYSSDFKADIGPQPTEFIFETSEAVTPSGPVRAIGPKKKKDRTWDTEFTYFETTGEFRQLVRVAAKSFTIRGVIKGQLCNEQDGTCTLFEESVNLAVHPVAE